MSGAEAALQRFIEATALSKTFERKGRLAMGRKLLSVSGSSPGGEVGAGQIADGDAGGGHKVHSVCPFFYGLENPHVK